MVPTPSFWEGVVPKSIEGGTMELGLILTEGPTWPYATYSDTQISATGQALFCYSY